MSRRTGAGWVVWGREEVWDRADLRVLLPL